MTELRRVIEIPRPRGGVSPRGTITAAFILYNNPLNILTAGYGAAYRQGISDLLTDLLGIAQSETQAILEGEADYKFI